MYKNYNNEKNSPAPYLVGLKRNFTLNIFLQNIRENEKVSFFLTTRYILKVGLKNRGKRFLGWINS